ncbi:O-antigen ligase family protein [Piscinibacter sakaiensis]|uniref:RbmD protein n=1 Tax=Piscinibacter sakaiensis TaxID=1547922 RepID=A0A0K8P0D3_PISS1|nr:O-antigen ligase family protein [Piscinibacter sakaiensis]GAP35630.1 RbmD protein [Piscinibacter sakaiensis]
MRSASRSPRHDLLAWCLAAVLVWAPLPLGSNRAWAASVLCLAVGGLLLWAWARLMRAGRSPLAYLAPAAVPAGCLVGYAVWVLAQWAGGLAGLSGQGPGSADPFQTAYYALLAFTYAGLFAATLLIARDAQAVRFLSLVLVASGLGQALLAIVLLSVRAEYHFMYERISHGAQAIGSFVNRNHLAGYLYLCLSVGIGLLMGGLGDGGPAPRRWRDHAVNLLKFVLSRRMALRVLLVVMVIALVLSRSRMGNTAFLSALIVLGGVVAAATPALRGKALLLMASLVIVDILVVGQWVGLDRVVQRIDRTALAIEDARGEETVEARLEPARHTLAMIEARPWAGTGGGTYYTVFPAFKQRAMLLHLYYFDHAHNDYAEIAADTGLVGLGLLGAVVLASLWRVRKLLGLRQAPASRGVAYGALMAITCLLLHSMVDFNLQIPANALTITAILGLLWATPIERRTGGGLGAGRARDSGAGGSGSALESLPGQSG